MSNLAYNIRNTDTAQELRIMEKPIEIEVTDKAYYSSEEIASIFDVSQSRIRQLRIELGIEGEKVGSVRLHTKADLIQIAEHRKIKLKFNPENA